MSDEIKVYYPDTIEYQPLTSEAVEIVNDTGSTSNKTASGTEAQGGTVVNKSRKFPPRPIPVPVMAKELISNSLNSQSRQILGGFTFSQTGSLQVGEYVDGVSGDIRISPNGITARNSEGTTTVSIDGTTGDATFLGTIVSGSVISASVSANLITGTIVNAQIADIEWAKITNVQIETADITSLDASVITSGTINASTINVTNLKAGNITSGNVAKDRMSANVLDALKVNVSQLSAITANIGSITAGDITGITITGTTITGGTITGGAITGGTITGTTITGGIVRTASAGSRVEMSQTDNELRVYSGSTKIIQMDEGGMWVRGGNQISLGGSTASGKTIEIYELGSVSGRLIITATNSIEITASSTIAMFGAIWAYNGCNLGGTLKMLTNGIDMGEHTIYNVPMINFKPVSSSPNNDSGIWYRESGSSYAFRSRMKGTNWQFDQSSV